MAGRRLVQPGQLLSQNQQLLQPKLWASSRLSFGQGQGNPLPAQGALLGGPIGHGGGPDAEQGHVQGGGAAAPVDQDARRHDVAPGGPDGLYGGPQGSAGGQHVFHHDHLFAGLQPEPPAQGHGRTGTGVAGRGLFGVHGPQAQMAGRFISQDDAAHGGADDRGGPVGPEQVGQQAGGLSRQGGVLKQQGQEEKTVAVAA